MSKKGFSLIEIAIILIILGTLIVGLIKGQELIAQSKINGVISNLRKYNAAVNTFYIKYEALPGDIERASIFGLNTPDGETLIASRNVSETPDVLNNGDGDETLEGGANSDFDDFEGEMANFWVHLSNANLLPFQFEQVNDCSGVACNQTPATAFPETTIGNGIIALTERRQLYWVLGVSATILDLDYGDEVDDIGLGDVAGANGSGTGATLTPEEAFGIDSKLDDGFPDIGLINAVSSYSNPTSGEFTLEVDGGAVTEDCMFGGGYNMLLTQKACTIRIMNFVN